ncbi:MAG: dihydropteroate synthase [Verrucomicrobia bacterium]|nr:dihydropteroate synthase [Verrucomicrobiota bacterium]
MLWQTKNRLFDFTSHGVVMGILNLTLDSFSDGGRFFDPELAVQHALKMEAEGAQIIDIGGESTRPGAAPVSEAEELARVVPVIERLAGHLKAVISIDTSKAAVARAAVQAGAGIINDVTALLGDPEMPRVAAESGAGIVLMHMQGTPRTMQAAPHYDNVVAEVRDFFRQSAALALRWGIDPLRIAFDPGIGFGKTVEHNVMLLRELPALQLPELPDRPLVLGVSRKTFLGKLLNDMAFEQRFWPTVALTSLGRELGAVVFRVHDVKANLEALRMTEAICIHA